MCKKVIVLSNLVEIYEVEFLHNHRTVAVATNGKVDVVKVLLYIWAIDMVINNLN